VTGETTSVLRRLRARLLSWQGLALLLAVLLLAEIGVPRVARTLGITRSADDRFAKVCRDRGGTPSIAPGSGDYVKDARSCVVRYGAHTYEMYAVTPDGFDEREVARAHQACSTQARTDKQLDAGTGAPRRRVWHPRTAICESQP
jgi:hypothetical protein